MSGDPLRAVIVDDEPLARERLHQLVTETGRAQIVGSAGDGFEALTVIEQTRPDVVFLDVEMPEIDGLVVAQQLVGVQQPLVMFVTAYERYAVAAFETRAIDYLLKPVSAGRLAVALDRASELVRKRSADDWHERLATMLADLGRPRYLERVAIFDRGKWTFVPLEAVDWIEAADNYVQLHVAGRGLLLREAISSLERRLDPAVFIRIHRRVIVHAGRIREVLPTSHGELEVILTSGQRLSATRTHVARLKPLLRNRL